MIIELDLLIAIVALLLALPAIAFQILGSQQAFSLSSARLGEALILNSGAQKLAFQLGSIGYQPSNLSYIANAYGYALLPYGEGSGSAASGTAPTRIVTVGGRLYYLLVRK